MTPPQDDPPNPPPATGPFPSNSPWGGQPRPVFRIGPLPTGRSAAAPPPAAPRLAYVAPIPRAGAQRSRVLTNPALSVAAPPPTSQIAPPPPVAEPPVAEPMEIAPPAAAPVFAPAQRRAARLAPNRTPLILGVGAVALAAVGAVVLLAARQGGQAAVQSAAADGRCTDGHSGAAAGRRRAPACRRNDPGPDRHSIVCAAPIGAAHRRVSAGGSAPDGRYSHRAA